MFLICFFYFLLFFWCLSYGYYIPAVILTVFFVLFFIYRNYKKKQLIAEYSQKIKYCQSLIIKNKTFEPFIDVNNSPWWILVLLPGISSSIAKHVANHVRKGKKFDNFTDFADFCSLGVEFINIVNKMVFFK